MSESRPKPVGKLLRKCVDCPAMIEVYGTRKRCPSCQDASRINLNLQRKRKGRK